MKLKVEKTLEDFKEKIIPILKKHKISHAGIFGSYARGDYNENSDVDILVDVPESYSLLKFAGIKVEIEDEINKSVDLVEYPLIHPKLKTGILKEEVTLI